MEMMAINMGRMRGEETKTEDATEYNSGRIISLVVFFTVFRIFCFVW